MDGWIFPTVHRHAVYYITQCCVVTVAVPGKNICNALALLFLI